MTRPKPSRASCPCCRNLGVLPHTDTTEVFDPRTGQTHAVHPGQTISAEVSLTLCDDCLAAVAFGMPHPHRLSVAITGARR